ncbi:DoxX family membrane protein [Rudanella paleaurantiibacter]|uniref:DoxX family membrane protein n=1 Tax=Rudanella paleaurantiibacter TaxID=2614655 RepID=A0A7J5TSI7_9BACT|nr:DoxX family protein [Rudanella paleaurantiibacter]KAB7725606.1 DoxX family membrane protein [Rudanella paleaurantiibacter]
MLSSLYSLSRFREFGVLLLRLAFGLQLVLSSWPYVSDSAKLTEFTNYLTTLGFPFPVPGAYVSAYSEFVGGLLLMLGLWTRPVALVLAFNFLVALLLAHVFTADTYQNSYPSANLLVVNLFLAFNGAGSYAIDARLGHR